MKPNEITIIFNFYKVLGKQVTQFSSIRMSNIIKGRVSSYSLTF